MSDIKICLLFADIHTDYLVRLPLTQGLLFKSDSNVPKFVSMTQTHPSRILACTRRCWYVLSQTYFPNIVGRNR